MTDIDDMIRERIQAELAERQQRRERLRAARRDFDHRRRYAKDKINRERLEKAMHAASTDPRDQVRHTWSCPPSRRVVVQAVETQPTGQALVVQRCVGCGGTDSTSSDDSPDAA